MKLSKIKRILTLTLAVAMIFALAIVPVNAKNVLTGSAPANGAGKAAVKQLKSTGYEKIASGKGIEMYADMGTGKFAVINTANGYTWYSSPINSDKDVVTKGIEKKNSESNLVIGITFKADEVSSARINDYSSAQANDTQIEAITNGFRATYTWELDVPVEQKKGVEKKENEEDKVIITKVIVPVEFKLDGNAFKANIDFKNVKFDDSKVLLTQYSILPYFGAGSWTDEGYIFVPDGSGALINFTGHNESADYYDADVYGEDIVYEDDNIGKTKQTKNINMPVFGIKNGDNAMIGVISKGAEVSAIKATPVNKNQGFATVGARISTRTAQMNDMFVRSANSQTVYRFNKQSENTKSFEVTYYFMQGKDADYVGMANKYREYLEANKMLNKEGVTKPSLNVDVIGAIDLEANFLGFAYRKLRSVTTFEQAQQMADELKKENVDNLSMRYIGWGNNGVTNKKILTSAKVLGLLGGKKGFTNLVNYMNENGNGFTADVDFTTFTKGSTGNACKNAYGQIYYLRQHLKSVYVYDLKGINKYMIRPDYVPKFASKYLKTYKTKTGIDNISVSTLTSRVYSHNKLSSSSTKADMPINVQKVLQNAKDQNLKVSGDNANDYTFKYLSKIYKAPMYSSAYNVFDSEIPFYQIVLHGTTAMTGEEQVQSGNPDKAFLKCVESGMELLWDGMYDESAFLRDSNYDDYFGATFSLWKKDAGEKYAKYQPILDKIYNQKIVSHKEVSKDVTCTEYANGVKVYVNFSEATYNGNGLKIGALDFAVKEG